MKNVACSRLGTMLHLDILKRKEDMKISNFQKDFRGTTTCMKIIDITTKGWVQLASNETYFDDSWFVSVKTAEDMAATEVDYCWTVKTVHKSFCLAMFETLITDWPGGSYIVAP